MSINKIIEKVEDYKEQIKKSEIEKAKLDGKKEEILKYLKDKFNISSIKEAEEQLEKLKKDKKFLEEEIEEKMEKLKNDYEWE